MARELLNARNKRLQDDEIRAIAAIVRDPVRFSRHILGHDPWSIAERILTAVATKRRVAVKACHSSGKTFTAAEAALWWVMRYADGKVITTAPTWTQVERLLWGEMRIAAAQSKISLPEVRKTQLDLEDGNFAIGLSTNEGVRFQGWHGGHILIILDEAPGVLAEIYEAIEGIEAGGEVHILLLGNPVVAAGPFYNAFTVDADQWERFTISAFDTPNLAGIPGDTISEKEAALLALPDEALDENVRPYLTTRRWVRDRLIVWKADHPKYTSRVLAQFPKQSEYSLVSLDWIERAEAKRATSAALPVEAGVDV
ncbi:MAG: terminase family protein, partial [Gemmatimonas sp.]